MNRLMASIQRLIGRKNAQRLGDDPNPWAGLMSYADPAAGGTSHRFCGRDRETADMFYLVDNNFIVTIYGKSGIGKTSLLNAGLFPRLRAEGYHPVSIRLGLLGGDDLTSRIIELIESDIRQHYGDNATEYRDIDTLNARTPDSRLWRFFASHRFHNKSGEVIFPVLVFDQFEEVLRHNQGGAMALLRELSFIADPHNAIGDGYVAGKPYSYDFNFRFVLSIREDDLYRLEDTVDRNFIARIKDCRYRLQNLTDEGAAQVVGEIGKEFIAPADLGKVTRLITGASRNAEDGLINTNLLSLLCARMYQRFTDSKARAITASMVEQFISANPFEEYYEEAVRYLSESEKRFIEDRLIDPDGRRNAVSEKEFSDNVRNSASLFDGRNRIMQRVSAGTGSRYTNVELLHDAMCPTVLRNRALRLERKNSSITSLYLIIIGAISFYFLNSAIIDNLAGFFLDCMNGRDFTFEHVEAPALFLAIITFPMMTGLLVYGYRMPRALMALPLLIAAAPTLCFHDFNVTSTMGIATIAITAIATIMLSLAWNSTNKSLSPVRALAKVWGIMTVKCNYLLLAFYLGWMSMLNTTFIIVNTDSSWMIIVIPYLILDLSFSLFGIRHNRRLTITFLCVLALMAASTFLHDIVIWAELCGLLVSAVLFWLMTRGKTLFERLLFTTFFAICLFAVLIANLGYRPWLFHYDKIERVFPWKMAIVKQDGLYGIADAETGRMLDEAVFDSVAGSGTYLIRTLDKPYVISDKLMIENSPWFLVNREGKWQLWSSNHVTLTNNIRRLANCNSQAVNDSLATTDNRIKTESAKAFFRLKNATISYVITGNDSTLRAIPYGLLDLSAMLQHRLNDRLRILSEKAESINEPMVCDVLEALARSLYINMIREALLKGRYTDACDWFLHYYIPMMLTDAIPDNYNVTFNSDHDSMLSVNDSDFSEPSVSMHFTAAQLAEHSAAAWYNMFYVLFNKECDSDSKAYLDAMQRNNNEMEKIARQSADYTTMHERSKKTLEILRASAEQAYAGQSGVLDELKDYASAPDSVRLATLSNAIRTMIDFNAVKKEITDGVGTVMADISASDSDMDSVLSTVGEIALAQVDLNFKLLIQSTYSRLLDIVARTPNNIYNGLFITLCERLYSIGALRLYDMAEYKEAMDSISSHRVSGMYRMVVRGDSLRRVQNETIKSMKETQDNNKMKLEALQNRLDSIAD